MIGPQMRPSACVNQLSGDADSIGAFAHRAFEHVPNAQFAADPLHVDVLALVGEARIAGEDGQPADAGEGGDDLLDNAVGEIFLLRIAAQIVERQDRERRLFRNRRARGGRGFVGGRRVRRT
jgi:hypothetical protein